MKTEVFYNLDPTSILEVGRCFFTGRTDGQWIPKREFRFPTRGVCLFARIDTWPAISTASDFELKVFGVDKDNKEIVGRANVPGGSSLGASFHLDLTGELLYSNVKRVTTEPELSNGEMGLWTIPDDFGFTLLNEATDVVFNAGLTREPEHGKLIPTPRGASFSMQGLSEQDRRMLAGRDFWLKVQKTENGEPIENCYATLCNLNSSNGGSYGELYLFK
jgi:hypothetical protein